MAKEKATPTTKEVDVKTILVNIKRNARAVRELRKFENGSEHIKAAIAELDEKQNKLREVAHKLLDAEIDAAIKAINE